MFEHGEAEAGSAQMNAEHRRSMAMMAWSNTAETLLRFSVVAPCCIAHVCPLLGTEAGWGALCHASLHMKATALDASSLNWLNFRQKFAPLIKLALLNTGSGLRRILKLPVFELQGYRSRHFHYGKSHLRWRVVPSKAC